MNLAAGALASPVGADGQPLYVGVFAPGDDPALYDPVRTYCDDLTIEQLIASGRYNVIDFRSGGKVVIRGTAGDDLVLGGSNHNLLLGGEGNDCIITGGGGGQAYGNAGDDIIFGSENDERLVGGHGNDECHPAGGNDIIVGCEKVE